jgi:hypothetical protein
MSPNFLNYIFISQSHIASQSISSKLFFTKELRKALNPDSPAFNRIAQSVPMTRSLGGDSASQLSSALLNSRRVATSSVLSCPFTAKSTPDRDCHLSPPFPDYIASRYNRLFRGRCEIGFARTPF